MLHTTKFVVVGDVYWADLLQLLHVSNIPQYYAPFGTQAPFCKLCVLSIGCGEKPHGKEVCPS